MFRQCARSKNIIEKDCNTKYFHVLANRRMRKNMINKIKISGVAFKGRIFISRKIKEHFQSHFKQKQLPTISLPKNAFRKLSHPMAIDLESILSDLQNYQALKSCDPYKAPGFDGYNLKFLVKM